MVDKDVAEDRETGIERRDLANVGLEGGTKPAERRWGVELGNLPFGLLAEELSF
jgi:hypothetical protein